MAELQRRVELLDKDNRQLQTQLAQSEQQIQIYRDELNLMREELANTVQQLETTRLSAQRTQQQFQGLQASTQFRGGATLKANTNVRQIAEALSASGFPAIYEADAAKLIVPADQLFVPGTDQLLPQAANMLTPLAAQISRVAARQRINVEGYWDDAPLTGGQFVNAHQLTSAQAGAVARLLTQQGGLPQAQVGTAGYGATRPRQSNQSAAGRAANRRVEIVILPDTF
jgi:flagellar motor protein MotB